MENQTNPLKNYFRKPGIWVKLPSQGKFYKDKIAELNEMGEIPVFPMTAKDELILKNADALLNGSAVYQLLESCVPCIKNAKEVPSIDLDVLLLAIRRCTYSESMEITTVHDCKDNATNETSLNLDYFISTIKTVDNVDPIELSSGVKLYIKPVNLEQLLTLNWAQYEQIRNIQLAEQQNLSEKEKVNILQNGFEALTKKNVEIIAQCVDTVLLPDGTTVTDQTNILEWIRDLSSPEFKKIELAVMGLGELGVAKKFKVQCQHCNKEYESQIELNPTTFFG